MTTKLRVELLNITCRDTEDITRPDSFYLAGGGGSVIRTAGFISSSAGNAAEHISGVDVGVMLTTPISINDGQTKSFSSDECVLFDGYLADNAVWKGSLVAYDEDCGKSWANRPDWVDRLKNEVERELLDIAMSSSESEDEEESGGGWTRVAAAICLGIIELLVFLARVDRDDKLGEKELRIPARGSTVEDLEWTFSEGGWGISTWDYTLRYRITRTTLPNQMSASTKTRVIRFLCKR